MQLKEKWDDLRCKVLYLFKPIAVIRACLVFMIVVDAALLPLTLLTSNPDAKNIYVAILTGITASVLVAVIIEMTNNYQRNDKRWLQLSRLFSALTHYEEEIDTRTGKLDVGRAHLDMMKEVHENLVREGTETEEEARQALEKAAEAFSDDEEDEYTVQFRDRIRSVFDYLPKIIPLIEDAYQNHSSDFRRIELESMYTILSDYDQIKECVAMTLMEQSTLRFGKDPKNPGDLVEWLPKRLKKDLDRGTLLALAMEVWDSERKKIAEILVRHGYTSLSSLGIEISEGLNLDDDSSEELEPENNDGSRKDNAFGRLVSHYIEEIDSELLNLQEIIKIEPGFRTIFAYFQKYSLQYKR